MGSLCGSDIAEAANSHVVGWLLLVAVSMTQQAMWPQFVVLVCLMWLCWLREHLLHPIFRVLSEQVGRWAFGLGIDALRLDQLNGVVPNRTRQAVVAGCLS